MLRLLTSFLHQSIRASEQQRRTHVEACSPHRQGKHYPAPAHPLSPIHTQPSTPSHPPSFSTPPHIKATGPDLHKEFQQKYYHIGNRARKASEHPASVPAHRSGMPENNSGALQQDLCKVFETMYPEEASLGLDFYHLIGQDIETLSASQLEVLREVSFICRSCSLSN